MSSIAVRKECDVERTDRRYGSVAVGEGLRYIPSGGESFPRLGEVVRLQDEGEVRAGVVPRSIGLRR